MSASAGPLDANTQSLQSLFRELEQELAPTASRSKEADKPKRVRSQSDLAPPSSATAPAPSRVQSPSVSKGNEGALQTVLPFWPPTKRPVVHLWARSALFTAGFQRERDFFEDKEIATSGYFTIVYKGQELRQKDLDVLMQLLHIQRGQSPAEYIMFRRRRFLTTLGWQPNARGYTELMDSLRRMMACSLLIIVKAGGRKRYAGNIVADIATKETDDGDELTAVRLNHKIVDIMRPGDYSTVDIDLRRKLTPLGKWLHYFITSKRADRLVTHPPTVKALSEMSGTKFKRLRAFEAQMVVVLEQLVTLNVINRFEIDDRGLVHIEREHTALEEVLDDVVEA